MTRRPLRIILDSEEKLIRGILGDAVFGIDDESMEFVILKQLRETKRTVAAAESITGGIMSSRMSALDPEMQTFLGATIGPDGRRAKSMRRCRPTSAPRLQPHECASITAPASVSPSCGRATR